MLEIEGVTKKFGGLTAVNAVSFTMKKGEILGLIGPNGSGKTTMFNIITGFLKPTEGTVKFNNEIISDGSPHEIVYKGISRTFQITSLLSERTVEENILFGLFSRVNTGFLNCLFRGKKYHEQEETASQRVEEVLKLIGLQFRKKELAKNIASSEQRKLMIGIALARSPKLLLLDEPAAGTSREEQQELINMVQKIRDKGTSVLVIEHHMHLIMNLCDRIVAFNFGEKIADGIPMEIQNHPAVIQAYLGRKNDAS
ncbi:ABC transporter ATP-binding protein [Bacillus sp. JJ1533]|uniref:ABC transporter ATP-binding protein n=1 Tax=Bacillus sp. JJ1533 TaxID=3122959 RepID=UPI002FFFCEBA